MNGLGNSEIKLGTIIRHVIGEIRSSLLEKVVPYSIDRSIFIRHSFGFSKIKKNYISKKTPFTGIADISYFQVIVQIKNKNLLREPL